MRPPLPTGAAARRRAGLSTLHRALSVLFTWEVMWTPTAPVPASLEQADNWALLEERLLLLRLGEELRVQNLSGGGVCRVCPWGPGRVLFSSPPVS